MDLELSQEDLAFRDGLREVFLGAIPEEIRKRSALGLITRDDIVTSQRILNEHGLAVPHWPVEWGGRDWTPTQSHIYASELQRNAVPQPLAFNASMVGPIIAEFGSEEQKQKFLPATANLDIWWSQGFSEPEAGSDLAGLRTTAKRDGDHYVLNGQKTWTTLGQYGDWMFVLARTNPDAPRKQQGLSFLLLDLNTPGIERRPIKLVDGSAEVNEFFFDNVVIPAENLVGEENKGWTYAKFLLGNERNGIAQVGTGQRIFADLAAAAADLPTEDGPLSGDAEFRAAMHTAKTTLLALEATQMRVTAASENGQPSPVSSLLKMEGTQALQALTKLRMRAAGSDGMVLDTESPVRADEAAVVAAAQYLNQRKLSIFGGSNEIQRGVIAKTILGL
ncbi:acyl-CoA dehydrogenase [Amycolatopsis rubida]|uniref:Acyl-CoA dehydrogenase n=1 Tax=Amycolatopsis rubida TaxID=112413 RepID=A0A1I5W9Y4_9PSEU|nr:MULTISPECIES: acyl-CoA dehydrogenase family protein [Amycolatopsis]MYW95268.1 acyl-CoA dehydrogenase [Amycolatopsis rubida]NEC60257.1 acyl-CoA dehydrogenase [Amycolatopsis rubida]OAP28333.1 Acyl-CoA dehydrogenase [Amycolatopsis sp. M39]SFQ16525.1 Acyl-CoA dehydrogenase [Amycolatopsis rubida]